MKKQKIASIHPPQVGIQEFGSMMQEEVKEHLKKMKRSGSKTSDTGSKMSDTGSKMSDTGSKSPAKDSYQEGGQNDPDIQDSQSIQAE